MVPVVVFGEVDLYELRLPKEGSWVQKLQLMFKDITGVMPIRFIGEGFFGLAPKPLPVNVVGKILGKSIIQFMYFFLKSGLQSKSTRGKTRLTKK